MRCSTVTPVRGRTLRLQKNLLKGQRRLIFIRFLERLNLKASGSEIPVGPPFIMIQIRFGNHKLTKTDFNSEFVIYRSLKKRAGSYIKSNSIFFKNSLFKTVYQVFSFRGVQLRFLRDQ